MDDIVEHCHESMEEALSAERYSLWKRACPELIHPSGKKYTQALKNSFLSI